jgi:aldehyde:ferredoxin oxidoreductase
VSFRRKPESSLFRGLRIPRQSNISKIFNIPEGFTAKNDKLPDRYFQPSERGPLDRKKLDAQEFRQTLKTDYQMMEWDENGISQEGKLEELKLEWTKPLIARKE